MARIIVPSPVVIAQILDPSAWPAQQDIWHSAMQTDG